MPEEQRLANLLQEAFADVVRADKNESLLKALDDLQTRLDDVIAGDVDGMPEWLWLDIHEGLQSCAAKLAEQDAQACAKLARSMLALDSFSAPTDARYANLEEAEQLAADSSELLRSIQYRLGLAAVAARRHEEAAVRLERLLAAEGLSAEQTAVGSAYLALARTVLGDRSQRPVPVPEEIGDIARVRILLANFAIIRDNQLDEDSHAVLDQAVEGGWRSGNPTVEALALRARAALELSLGNTEAARQDLEEAITVQNRPAHSMMGCMAREQLIHVLLALGKEQAAEAVLAEVEGYMDDRNPVFHAWFELYRGDLCALEDDWRGAATHYRAAGRSLGAENYPELNGQVALRNALVTAQRGQLAAAQKVVAEQVPERITEPEREVWNAAVLKVSGTTHSKTTFELLSVRPRSWWLRKWVAPLNPARVEIASDGSWIRCDNHHTDIRPTGPLGGILRALLETLADPSKRLDRADIAAAGWPGERYPPRVMKNRVNVSLNRLRGMGLREHILHDEGWHLDPSVEVALARA